mmetsp:Transcript_8324/g.30434  ORF Transcript_8324/g.30434 Transcript_8324/m.30434 type:complete len:124 (-) Transcript_8324:1091-1462(-)
MRLLTHNLLASNVKGTTAGFPLKLEVLVKEERSTEFDAAFLLHTLPKLNWSAFRAAAESLGVDKLPSTYPERDELTNEFLQVFHHALLEIEVQEGYLICPESGRRFPVRKGIPNMMLNEDEVD